MIEPSADSTHGADPWCGRTATLVPGYNRRHPTYQGTENQPMKRLINAILDRFEGRIGLQRFYEILHLIAVGGMNYGNGGNFRTSGELAMLRTIKARYRPDEPLVLFDVGSNVGHYAVELARFFGKRATVHAFEPSQRTYAKLMATIKDTPTVVAHMVGLSDEPKTHTLYLDKEGSGLASVYQRNLDHFGMSMDQTEEIRLDTLDAFCAGQGIDRIHFLKLDVEGHELSALKGAARMLSEGRVDLIQFEFGGCNIDSRTFFRDFFYMLNDRYKIHRIVRNGLREIPHYRERDEIFMTINYLAVRR